VAGDRTLIVVPTYNERENLEELFEGIQTHVPGAEVLVVDDGSPDGTGELATRLGQQMGGVRVLQRGRRLGIGSAYVEGFRRGLAEGYRLLCSMDADLSHEPRYLPALVGATEHADVAVGSRYLHGVSVLNWSLKRLALSVSANTYVHWVTGLPVRDCTSGFQCFRREALEAVDVDRLRFSGYSFLVEIKYRVYRKGFRIREVPIVFADRKFGVTKMNRREIMRSMWAVWAIRFTR
jgi:dolichol-phosphate mannosyltransferase